MPLLETAALALGSVLAKEVAKGLLGKDSNLLDAAGALIDLLKDQSGKSLADTKEARKIEALSREIAQRTLLLFDSEGSRLDEDDRKRVVAEVAATIASRPLTPQFIIENNNDPQRVARAMLTEREAQVAKAQLSDRERSLYERMVTECVRGISEVVITTDSFVPYMLGESMRRQDAFQDVILNAMVLRMAQERDDAYMRAAKQFEQQYRALVKQQFEKFEPFGIREVEEQVGQRRRVSQAYVGLSVRDLRKDQQGRESEDASQKLPSPLSIEDAVAFSPRLIITGVAGSGKSTLVKYLSAKTASDDLPETLRALQGMTPVVLRLRRCLEERLPNVEGWLALEFPNLQSPPEGWIRNQLAQGKAIVMIDGVDELSQARREAMLEDLQQLMLQYPAARYIVTSRPEALENWPAWREWIEAEGFLHVAIEPMSDKQRAMLVEHWFEAFRNTVGDVESLRRLDGMDEHLNDLLENRPPLGKLAVNPLMCAMVCALYERLGDSLPQRRTDLYDKCIDMALTLRDQQRGVLSIKDYKIISDSKDLLQHIAAWMTLIVEGDQTSIAKARMIAQMDRWLSERRITEATGEGMCRYFIERAGLLREPLEGLIEFEHRTFQEYLTAREMCFDDRLEELRSHIGDDRWREVIVLASGQCNSSQRKTIWKMIADPPDMTTKAKLSFMLDCLEVIGTRATQTEHEDAVRQLRGIIYLNTLDLRDTSVSDVRGLAALTNLQSLSLNSSSVSDVRGLAGQTNLQSLDLSNTGVSDVRGLAGLTNLQSLNLSDTGVSDVRGLAGLTNLQSLNLLDTSVSDVSALAGLTHLHTLVLSGTGLSDVRGLAGLTNLQSLVLRNIGVSDVSALAALMNLQTLSLSDTGVSDVSALAGLTNLQTLSLFNTGVSDVRALAALTNLHTLSLNSSGVSEVRGLVALTHLQSLNLSYTGVSDVRALVALTHLQSLDLSNTGVSDVSGLAGLAHLQTLDLRGTRVSDVRALAVLTHLQTLDLISTGVGDLRALAALTNLQSLFLNRTDVSGLAGLTNLQSLVLRCTGLSNVSDVSVLAGLTNLQSLDLNRTDVSDVRALAGLTNLQSLNLSYTGVSDVRALAGLTNLQSLNLLRTGVSDVSALAGLTHLHTLDLSGTGVSDVRALAGLTHLQTLDLISTGVGDLRALAGLTNLQRLDLSNTKVSDLSPLRTMTDLKWLDVRGTALKDLSQLAQFTCLHKLAVSPEYWSEEIAKQIKRNNPEIEIYIAFPEDYIEALYE